jgi:hypothetical protein
MGGRQEIWAEAPQERGREGHVSQMQEAADEGCGWTA